MISDVMSLHEDREYKDRSSRLIMLDLYKEVITNRIEMEAVRDAVKDKSDIHHTHDTDYKQAKEKAEKKYKKELKLVETLEKQEEAKLEHWTSTYKRSLKEFNAEDHSKKKQSRNKTEQMNTDAKKIKTYDYIDKDDDDS